MNSASADLLSKGFVNTEYPEGLRNAVIATVGLWKKFCALPVEVKKGLPYSNNADGVGYEIKDGIGNKADRKENFDVTIAGQEWLHQNILKIQDQTALGFVSSAIELVKIMKPTILHFARRCEGVLGINGLVDEVAASESAFFVRFIHYFGDRDIGQEIATAHADQSAFTLHLFESAPGLQRLQYCDKLWIDMPVSEGETVIIPGMQLQLRTRNELRALCHRVIATPETAKGGRYSAVCFVQLKNTPRYDKDNHGRLQEKTPGFNYGMPHEEFSKFFKK